MLASTLTYQQCKEYRYLKEEECACTFHRSVFHFVVAIFYKNEFFMKFALAADLFGR